MTGVSNATRSAASLRTSSSAWYSSLSMLQRGPVRERAARLRHRPFAVSNMRRTSGCTMIGSAGFVRRFRAGQRAHLQAFLRVDERVLIRDFRQPQPLHADAQTRGVHHHEHRVQAFVRFADEPALRAVQIDHASGVAVDAHLVFDGTALHAVALAGAPVVIRNELRHDEQRDALRARSGASGRRASTRCTMFSAMSCSPAGDEDLGAADRVRAVGLFGSAFVRSMPRSVPQCGSVRHMVPVQSPSTSFGRYVFCNSGAPCACSAFVRAMRQAGVHRPGLVRRIQHFEQRVVHERGQALAAVFGIATQCRPAALPRIACRLP